MDFRRMSRGFLFSGRRYSRFLMRYLLSIIVSQVSAMANGRNAIDDTNGTVSGNTESIHHS